MKIIIFILILRLLWQFLLKNLFFKFNAWGLKSKRNSTIGFSFLMIITMLFPIIFIYNIEYVYYFFIYLFDIEYENE